MIVEAEVKWRRELGWSHTRGKNLELDLRGQLVDAIDNLLDLERRQKYVACTNGEEANE